jgi:regulatory protein
MDNKLYEKAAVYVSALPKTEKQARLWLLRKRVNKNEIDEIIERLKDNNFLNDREYAKQFIFSEKERAFRKLLSKGIDYETAKEAANEYWDRH